MARPYKTDFEKEIQSPMSPVAGGGSNTPISYKVDVNRKKTNKWANAKPVTYDDWDDDDEYNDESAPPSKPTGLKQQGQSLAAGKKNYGDLPPAQETGARANSFDADDEVRNFSSGAATSPPITATAPGPVTRFSQMAVPQSRTASGPPALSVTTQMPLPQAATGMRKASAPMPPISQEYSAPVGRINPSETAATASLVSLADSRTSSDYQARRDYSPSAVPSPLRPAGAAVTSSPQTSDPPTARFPARKSSLSQSRGPDISDVTRAHQEAVTASHATQPKSLPFVRPADIYKRRMEEERERQSLDSSRPSVDSVRSNKVNEKPEAMSDVPGSSDRRDESTDSSRLRLEPVQERKSEYGFERDNGDQNTPRAPGLTFQPPLSEADKDEAGDIRSNPTSPQLPNLNRMSGFGMDLFTKSKQNIYAEPIREETTETPTGTALDTRLEPMPATNSDQSFSPGFQTVVNQAFEKKRNDSSPPPASVSQSNGAVQIGRERTGTVGISPVMKSLPAVPSLDSRMDDARPSNAATIESDVRDNIPQVNKPIPSQQVSGISNTQEQPAFLGGNIAKSNAGDSDEPLQPPRPIVERDQSFRPHLPGGWESYATTPGRESPVASVQLASDASSMARSGSPPSLKVHKESELAPTAAEHFSEVGIPVTGAALTKSKKSRENSPAKNAPSSGPAQSNDRFPTPDHSMAPGGSLYSHTALDPRLLSKPEQTVQAKQTRPEIISEPSFDSEAAPISLPRNTPKVVNDNPEYFPAYDTAPKKSLTEGASGNPTHEQPEPSMSSTAQDSNDQFHDEISRGLSPQPAIQRTDSLGVESPEEKSSNQTRISSYLPSEYDNYWASTAEGVTPAAVVTAPAENFDNQTLQTTNPTYTLTPVAMDTPLPADRDLTPEPLSPRKHEHIIEPISQSHRSSWEAKSEHQSATPVYSEPVVNTDEVGKDHSHEGARVESQPIHTPVPKPSGYEGLKSHSTTPTPESQPQHVTGTDATLVGGGLALGVAAAAAAYQHSSEPPSDPQRRLSLAEEKNPRVSSYPVSPTPPEDEHPSRCSQPNCSQIDIAALLPSTVSNVSAPSGPSVPSSIVTNSPTHAQHQPPVAILPFKDIVALQSPQQRSQKFDETRKTFAAMDSGLTSWISSLQSQYPEHRDTTGSFGRPTLDQSKFGRSPTGATPQLQQPYYQQYLNASSPTTPGNQSLRPGPSTSVGSQHGFHPPASQMTQQVQAKSKELLHTAGVFSGKAGKVGKGLLARGKNKLRGAGGGDKNTSSLSDKPGPTRRTSWGIPMSIIRSSGKQESSTRTSRESTYVPMNNRQRSATLIMLDTSRGQDKGPMTAATDDSYAAMSAPGILDNISNMSSGLPASDNSHKARMNYPEAPKQYTEHFENDGNLNTPAPIGKQQPSWDAGNTTPIMEEEAFHSDSDPVTRQMDHLENADSMNELARDDDSRLPREYESSKDRAWVMVSENSDLTPPKAFDEPPKIPDILTFDSHFCMNNDEDSTPTVTQHDLGSLDVKHEDGARISSESGRERAPSILDRPRYSYDVIRADVPNGPNPSATSKQIEHNPASIPPIGVAAISSFPSGRENYESRPVAGPRKSSWTAAQHEPQDRPRYSYDVPRADPFLGRSASRNAQSNHGSPVIDTAIAPKSQHADPEPSTASSFKGLPSFRRSSTFGFGFNTRAARQSADAKNEEPVPALLNQSAASSRRSSEVAIAAGVATPEGIANRDAHRESFQHEQDLNRALPTHVASLIELPPSSQHPYTASAAFDPEGVQRSQDSWRPQAVTPTDQELRGRWADSSEPRPSYEQQPRIKEFTRLPSYQVSKLGDQPPSSAQRYPNLFRGGQDIVDDEKDGDLPAHYYQPPIPREETFLPRQQTNEYQLSGVGPPDESRPAERPNSLVRDIANKIRSASRKRRNSVSSQGLTFRRHDTQGTDYAESNVTSNDGQDQTKRKRTSFFGRSSRSSINERPETRESTQAHFAGSMRSRGDQLFTPGQSPITGPDKTHVFFGEERPPGVQIGNIAARASMDGRLENQGKKKPSKRFSSLSSMFARSKDGAPKSTMMGRAHALSMSSQERRFTTSHIPEQRGMPPPARAKAGGGFFARLSTGAESALSPQPKMRKSTTNPALAKKILGLDVTYNPDNGNQREERAVKQEPPMKKPMPTSGLLSGFKGEPSSTSKEAKTRKSSTAELLSALMGQKSQHGDKQEDSSSQRGRSTGEYHPSQQHTHVLPQKASPGSGSTPQQQQMMYLSFQGNEPAPQENPRGRRESRQTRAHMRQAEPTYDAVPIPGGYDFVRGEGSLAAPRGSAQYQQPQKDPRLSRQVNLPAQRDYRLAQQQDPRYTEQQDTYDQNSLQQNPRYAQQDDRSYTQQSPSVARQSLPNSVIYSQYIDQKSTPSPSLNQSDRSSQGRQNLGTDSPNGTQRQSTPRINRDDLIARSPARAVIGQQRPYQLSLPEDPDDHKSISIQKSIPLTSPPSSTQSPIFPHPKNKAIEGHGRPTLRHHESPASYPLLDDTVFSPINPSASTLTPPPPPKWPASMDNKDDPHLAIGTSIGVGRSNTWATAASGVSQMSVEKAPGMLVPNASGADRTAHSPTPPSPSITPPLTSHQPPQQQQNLVSDRNSAIKQTTLTRAQSPDLYDASPRLPKPVTDTETERERLRVQKEKDMKSAQEEKIFWDKERGEEGRGDDVSEEPVMTATSFPGQGWDPYIYGDGEEY